MGDETTGRARSIESRGELAGDRRASTRGVKQILIDLFSLSAFELRERAGRCLPHDPALACERIRMNLTNFASTPLYGPAD
ncbi:hypothetical protein ACUWEX_03785 [Okibacterium fritillariae]|uniref:hypothetical protein n=1 Tax=Okibacterium fritillariae TaxID=123320 RepID=UPI0040558280